MTKQELLAGLENVRSNFLYGLACQHLTGTRDWDWLARNGQAVVGGIAVDLAPIATRMLDVAHSERLIHQFESHLLRATLREAHELILLYCRATSQFPLYRNLPWFQFARIIRNVVSHGDGRTLVEWPKDLRRNGVTQAVWRHRVLDAAMEGTRIHFTEAEGLELLDDKTTFAATRLQ